MLPSVPFRPQSRRERHESSALDAHSPLDSGYGSASPPPSAPKDLAKENRPLLVEFRNHYDGNQSDSDDPLAGSDQDNLVADVAAASLNLPSTSWPRHHLRRTSATLPLRTPRPSPFLPVPFRPFPNARFQEGRSSTTPLRYLDRFIPARHWGTTPSERFRVGKPPQELANAERLVRHNGATEDAFVYRRRIVTPLGPASRSRSRAATAASRNEG
jgi:meiosis-specific APC/C activator protein AMA1